MPKDLASLPYRSCAGVMLFNNDGKVWVGRRVSKWSGDTSKNMWQMPQGGIDKGETPYEAARRELEEEIGTNNAKLLAEAADWHNYDLPREALGIALKGKYRGQTQKWFAMRFLGADSEINILERPGHKAEFSAWEWADIGQIASRVVDFKRPVYEKLVEEFSAFSSV